MSLWCFDGAAACGFCTAALACDAHVLGNDNIATNIVRASLLADMGTVLAAGVANYEPPGTTLLQNHYVIVVVMRNSVS